jgi:3-hydroxyisobutyrate dehydrogenase
MVGHLIDAGFSATVYNRTQAKAEAALSKGAAWADSPKAVAEASDVVFSIVGFPDDVREVMLGEDGALAGSKAGQRPGRHDHQRPLAGRGDRRSRQTTRRHSVDAPVSGGDVGAKNAGSRS